MLSEPKIFGLSRLLSNRSMLRGILWAYGKFDHGKNIPVSFVWKSFKVLDWFGWINLWAEQRDLMQVGGYVPFLWSREETKSVSSVVNLKGQHLCKEMAVLEVCMTEEACIQKATTYPNVKTKIMIWLDLPCRRQHRWITNTPVHLYLPHPHCLISCPILQLGQPEAAWSREKSSVRKW